MSNTYLVAIQNSQWQNGYSHSLWGGENVVSNPGSVNNELFCPNKLFNFFEPLPHLVIIGINTFKTFSIALDR